MKPNAIDLRTILSKYNKPSFFSSIQKMKEIETMLYVSSSKEIKDMRREGKFSF